MRILNDNTFFDVRHPYLDKDISYAEITLALSKSKNKKTPGPDGIPFEFFKTLPQEWIKYLLTLLNATLEQESSPKKWCNISFNMLYKKGDKFDPLNYRPIALVNYIL